MCHDREYDSIKCNFQVSVQINHLLSDPRKPLYIVVLCTPGHYIWWSMVKPDKLVFVRICAIIRSAEGHKPNGDGKALHDRRGHDPHSRIRTSDALNFADTVYRNACKSAQGWRLQKLAEYRPYLPTEHWKLNIRSKLYLCQSYGASLHWKRIVGNGCPLE